MRVRVRGGGRGWNAAGVHRVERDARLNVESLVHLQNSHHVHGLGVLVRLGAWWRVRVGVGVGVGVRVRVKGEGEG